MKYQIKIKKVARTIYFIIQFKFIFQDEKIVKIVTQKEMLWSKIKTFLSKTNLIVEITKAAIIYLIKLLFKWVCGN